MPSRWARLLAGVAATPLVWVAMQAGAVATTLPEGFAEAEVARGIDAPVAMARTPDGRVLVAQQTGAVRVVRDGRLLPAPMLTLSVRSNGERGLLGVAVDPGFPDEPWVYVHYTVGSGPARNRVSRFPVSGDVADPAREHVLLDLDPLGPAGIHNGGFLLFAPDGTLMIGSGENAQPTRARQLDTTLGKVLRINRDGTIPADNPFAATAPGAARAIWASGLRNPFSADIQPGTGRLFVNDVGQASWEEVNDVRAARDHGWPVSEGPTDAPGITPPVYAYSSGPGASECAITGGAFHNPMTATFPPEFVGDYLFADHCAAWIRRLDPETGVVTPFATGTPPGMVAILTEPDGDVLYLTRDLDFFSPPAPAPRGRLVRIAYGAAPTIAEQPADLLVGPGERAVFEAVAGGRGPLEYRWLRDGAPMPRQTRARLVLTDPSPDDDKATFRVVVTSRWGSVTSRPARLRVTGNRRPVAAITAPGEGLRYAGGDVIPVSGTGADPEDGILPADALTWRVDFHHDTHLHPFLAPTPGPEVTRLTIPTVGETATDVWYRVHLTVRDSQGRTHSVFRDVHPRVVELTFTARPEGLRLLIDGSPRVTPFTERSVVGMERLVAPETPQTLDGVPHAFQAWDNGGPAEQVVSTPATDTTFVAGFAALQPDVPTDTPSGLDVPGALPAREVR